MCGMYLLIEALISGARERAREGRRNEKRRDYSWRRRWVELCLQRAAEMGWRNGRRTKKGSVCLKMFRYRS